MELFPRDEELASPEGLAHDFRRARLARYAFPPNLSATDRVSNRHPYSHPSTAAPAGSMSWSKAAVMMIKYENELGKLDAAR